MSAQRIGISLKVSGGENYGRVWSEASQGIRFKQIGNTSSGAFGRESGFGFGVKLHEERGRGGRGEGTRRMVDIGRISSRKWAIVLLVFLCVSAVLFIAPWILSVFYESDPYENWDEGLRLRSQETEGNMTLWCTSGPCVACTSGEKADAKFRCSPTGHHKAQQCSEDPDAAVDVLPGKPKQDGAGAKDAVQGKDQKLSGAAADTLDAGDETTVTGRSLVGEVGSQKTVIYKTCIPQEVKEKLSVFGFEGVVLVCLLLSAPAVHYRKRRGTATQGLQRIPSTARF